MRNADMPAMPQPVSRSDDGAVISSCDFVGGEGITKREYFMAHCAIDGDSLQFKTYEGLEEFVGRAVDRDSFEDIAKAQCEMMAKLKRMQVDADLAELERTGGGS